MTDTTKLDAAIAKVTAGVKRLAKGERNSHGGYNFAGIDDFLEMTGKLCGDAGLNVLMDEDEFEIIPEFFTTKSGKVAGLRMRFAIWLRCQGEKDGPYRRSIIVPANMGSQAFGAAQSYVEKQFLRATFQIPTGDKNEDLDAHDTGTMQRVAVPANDEPFDNGFEPARGEKLEGKHLSKSKLQAAMREFVENLRTAETSPQVEGLIDMYGEDLAQCRRYLPGWWEGNGTPEGRGVQGNIEDARGRVAADDGQLSIMIQSMRECDTNPKLAAWMTANEQAVEALDDKDGRTFQTAVDLHESGLELVATATA